jgi:type 1 glutamine amidotransferase
VEYYLALRRHKIPAALHIFQSGGHGFSMAEGMGSTENWPTLVHDWLEENHLLQKKLKALIVDGQNNHQSWKETTALLQEQLKATGIFTVDIARTPPTGADISGFNPNFSAYDVIISNYNGASWSKATQDNFEKYVHSGGGFVSFHAANNAFPEWAAYNEMIGLGGWGGRTEKDGPYVYYNDAGELIRDTSPGAGGHHGPQHQFTVTMRDTLHPITQGLPHEWLHEKDELYDHLRGPAKNINVLATAYSDAVTKNGTGHHEPMLMTIHYGEGRVFHTALGHAPYSMQGEGFITTLQRGAEWAATGRVASWDQDR